MSFALSGEINAASGNPARRAGASTPKPCGAFEADQRELDERQIAELPDELIDRQRPLVAARIA
jgi:hypothetical protein